VPEPSTFALAVVGTLGFVAWAIRRRLMFALRTTAIALLVVVECPTGRGRNPGTALG